MESVTVRPHPLGYHGGWSIDLDALAAEMSRERTRAVILVNPINLNRIARSCWAELASTACACVRPAAWRSISDEVFSDWAFWGATWRG